MDKTYIIVSTNSAERPIVYVAKSADVDNLAKQCQTKHQWMNIYELKFQQSQTPNPWGGAIITHEQIVHPSDDIDLHTETLCHAFDGVPVAQLPHLLERIQSRLSLEMKRRTDFATQLEASSEVIDLTTKGGEHGPKEVSG